MRISTYQLATPSLLSFQTHHSTCQQVPTRPELATFTLLCSAPIRLLFTPNLCHFIPHHVERQQLPPATLARRNGPATCLCHLSDLPGPVWPLRQLRWSTGPGGFRPHHHSCCQRPTTAALSHDHWARGLAWPDFAFPPDPSHTHGEHLQCQLGLRRRESF